MLTRKIGKMLRGDATPFQLMAASVLAGLIAFVPGFMQAPGLLVVYLALLIVLNANLALAALVGGGLKLLSLALMPWTFEVGYFLLEGPAQGIFQAAINAPVLAWFGLEHYVTTGGVAVGLILGFVVGLVIVGLLGRFRRKVVELEKNSEKFQAFNRKKWVRASVWVFVGSKSKKTYEEIMSRKIGNPIRPLGVVFVVLVGVLGVAVYLFASEPIVTLAVQKSLEQANGATVDIDSAELDLKENRLTLKGLAMADPNALDTDLLRAEALEADISGMSLLTKRAAFDRVVVIDGSQGLKRRQPGELVGPPPTPTPESETPDIPDAKSIEDYIEQAKQWKERLAQIKEWLEKVSPETEEAPPGEAPPTGESLRERLERQIRELGYAKVAADHLIAKSPTLTITELLAEKMRVSELGDETVDIHGRNLSTHPRLLGKPPEIRIRSSRDTLQAHAAMMALEKAGSTNSLGFSLRGLNTDAVVARVKFEGAKPVSGGTMDIAAAGSWTAREGVFLDLPLQVTLHQATLDLPQLKPSQVEELTIPIVVRGPMDSPAIRVEGQALAKALGKAGLSQAKEELTRKATETLKEKLGDQVGTNALDSLNQDVGEKGKKLLDGLLGGRKKDNE